MRNILGEKKPAEVPEAKQAGETASQIGEWVERGVWTERMLEALEGGVKGGKWFSLIDKVYRIKTLKLAWLRVKKNRGAAGVDHQSLEHFEAHLELNLLKLHCELRERRYHPRPIRRVWIEKPGSDEKRPLGIPTVRDRVVQAALVLVLEPIFEKQFVAHSYGFRPGRSCHQALERVGELLRAGYTHVVDIDFRSYFDSIPKAGLMEQVHRAIADQRVLNLIEQFLACQVFDGLEQWTPKGGTPQGAVLSPLLANAYLHPLDVLAEQQGLKMVRYADDLLILCQSQSEATRAWQMLHSFCCKSGLDLHPDKSRQVDMKEHKAWFDFLGYRFKRVRTGKVFQVVSPKSLGKLRAKLRPKTSRLSGISLQAIINDVNRVLKGWYEYFKHARTPALEKVDKWVRRRLRSILRKRSKRKGISKGGEDHHRWTNHFFRARGLFCLKDAHTAFLQSS